MTDGKNRVCPVELAGGLDSAVRRWLQNPLKILGPYAREGMTVLDFGCGPGFFSLAMARLVGASGRVISVDLQEGMLDKLRNKIRGTDWEGRIKLHRCKQHGLGLSVKVDFALAFYVVHEVPDPGRLFAELAGLIKPGGGLLIVEPPFHVSRRAFEQTIRLAREQGFAEERGPRVFFGRTALLRRI